MHNVEFKAELRDFALGRSICLALGATYIITLVQSDTYYRVPSGRLKRRETTGEPVEYIFYDRADRSQPKLSHFTIYSEAQALERFGVTPLPVWVVVQKSRDLFMIGGVRIHLDRVDGLGDFLEFEALVSPSQNVAKCHETIAGLRKAFGPAIGEPIACSYSDMLAGADELSGRT